MPSRRRTDHRVIVLYIILAVVVGNVVVSLSTGKTPPEILYGILGTLAGYVLITGDRAASRKEDAGEDEIPPGKGQRPIPGGRRPSETHGEGHHDHGGTRGRGEE